MKLENLEFIANILQIMSYMELKNQAGNDVILQELGHQNDTYLKKILKELEELNINLKGKVENVL